MTWQTVGECAESVLILLLLLLLLSLLLSGMLLLLLLWRWLMLLLRFPFSWCGVPRLLFLNHSLFLPFQPRQVHPGAPPRVLSTPFFSAWHSVFLPFRTIVDLNSPRAALSCHPALVGVSSSLFFSYSTFLPSGSANLLLFLLLRRLLLRILHFFEFLHFSLLFLASRKIQRSFFPRRVAEYVF